MNIVVRNSENVSECLLLRANDRPGDDLITSPEVKRFIGKRSLRGFSLSRPRRVGDPMFLELDLKSR